MSNELAVRLYLIAAPNTRKFHETVLRGTRMDTTYGKIGSIGSETIKEFDSEQEAATAFFKLLQSKMRKGYQIDFGRINGKGPDRAPLTRGAAYRERTKVPSKQGANIVLNLMSNTPDPDVIYDAMFADDDMEFLAKLAQSHPAAEDNELLGAGAFFAGMQDS